MRITSLMAVSGLSLALPLGAGAQQMNIKVGAWDTTWTTLIDMPVPAEIAQMPPERRAKVEAAFKARQGKAKTSTSRTCLTKQDLAEMANPKSDDDECRYTNVARTSSSWKADMVCKSGRTGHAEFTALSPEQVKGAITMRMPTSGGQGSVKLDTTAKWLGADCKKHGAD